MTAAAWFSDPQNPNQLRWWDGANWTGHTAPFPLTQIPVFNPAPVVQPTQLPPNAPEIKKGLFGGKHELEIENAQLKASLAQLGVAETAALLAQIESLRSETRALTEQRSQLANIVVELSESAILQEVGIYRYSHPLDSAVGYKRELDVIDAAVTSAARTGAAIKGRTDWTVNGSKSEGAKMVLELSKLMLRAYNNEADNALRTLKPYTVEKSIERLEKSRSTISRLGKVMSLEVTEHYHQLKIRELWLTADYLAKVAEEKDREREERARMKEEEVVRREIEREQARLQKERSHNAAAIASLRESGVNQEKLAELEAKVLELDGAIAAVDARAANQRTGYVYVISNVGAFGDSVVKVGMTRRLDPMDRVRELGDASVPFRFDVHAMIFSDDAVALENKLHKALEARRVNWVNPRREFFYAAPTYVKSLLETMSSAALLSFVETPEAVEWFQSETERRLANTQM
jgi:hypothetical protein